MAGMPVVSETLLPLRDGRPIFEGCTPFCLVCGRTPVTFVPLNLPIAGFTGLQMLVHGPRKTSRPIVAPLCSRHLLIQRVIQALGMILLVGPLVLLWMHWKHSITFLRRFEVWQVCVSMFAGFLTGLCTLVAGATGGVRGYLRDPAESPDGREALVILGIPANRTAWEGPPPATAELANPQPAEARFLADTVGFAPGGETEGARPSIPRQLPLSRKADGTLLFPEDRPFCLVCGRTVRKTLAIRKAGFHLQLPLCGLHWLQAQGSRMLGWLSLICYLAVIAVLVCARHVWLLEDLPVSWKFAVAAMAFVPTIWLWGKKVRGPVPARVALEEGGTRVVLIYLDGVPGRR